jgi:sulfate adenylyltransferase subunit 2
MAQRTLTHLRALEAESIHIIREVAAEFERPVMLYSIGKDSSVMVRLAQKAFFPGKLPFPLLHIDTTYKFQEMVEFRDRFCAEIGARLIVHTNTKAIEEGASPFRLGTQKCCALLKTRALLDALTEGGFDAAFGGARRDEEKSRAKERVYSFRDSFGQWDPKNQRPELWNLFNSRIDKGESIRVFPLSNWTELDVWHYIRLENIPIVPLYFAKPRLMAVRGETLIPVEHDMPLLPGEKPQTVMCRMRSLGCTYCTGAIRSEADTLTKIIEEMIQFRRSERENRVIDFDQEGSMEMKKREGYF